MIIEQFLDIVGEEPHVVVQAPGRINLIGEHTDYNEGFVLPAAIDKCVQLAVSSRKDDLIQLFSVDLKSRCSVRLSEIKPHKQQWPNYILGVMDQLLKQGHSLTGFNAVIAGRIPMGVGLSSSAALSCGSALALSELFQLDLSKLAIAHIARAVEHLYSGVQCGIMDQAISVFGRREHALLLDCRNFHKEYIPLHLGEYAIVLFDTQVKHQLAATAYNERREACEEAVKRMQGFGLPIRSLRDVTHPMLYQYINDPIIRQRCAFVLKENSRVLASCEDLRKGDIGAFGEKMFQSHEGLSREYEVSCPELDFLVNTVKDHTRVAGARMMGGGFGGCTINLIRKDAVEKISGQVQELYFQAMGRELLVYKVAVEGGASVLHYKKQYIYAAH